MKTWSILRPEKSRTEADLLRSSNPRISWVLRYSWALLTCTSSCDPSLQFIQGFWNTPIHTICSAMPVLIDRFPQSTSTAATTSSVAGYTTAATGGAILQQSRMLSARGGISQHRGCIVCVWFAAFIFLLHMREVELGNRSHSFQRPGTMSCLLHSRHCCCLGMYACYFEKRGQWKPFILLQAHRTPES